MPATSHHAMWQPGALAASWCAALRYAASATGGMPETVTVAVSTFGSFLMGAVAAGLCAAARNGRRASCGAGAGSTAYAVGDEVGAGRAAVGDAAGRRATTVTPVSSVARIVAPAGTSRPGRRRARASHDMPRAMRCAALTRNPFHRLAGAVTVAALRRYCPPGAGRTVRKPTPNGRPGRP